MTEMTNGQQDHGLFFDGHLDVAMNALDHERDQTWTVQEIRQRERGDIDDGRGTSMVSLPQLRESRTAVFVGTVLARAKPWMKADRRIRRGGDWPAQDMAYAIAQGLLAYYNQLERRGDLKLIRDRAALDAQWQRWQDADLTAPVGMILMMEGADAIVEPEQVHDWFDQGLRCLSLAHFGHSHYAAGTPPRVPTHGPNGEQDAPLTDRGRVLLREMGKREIVLDLTHLSDQSFADAIEAFDGPVCATHANCRSLADTPRQLTDDQIRRIVERDGVIGVAIHNAMLHQTKSDDAGDGIVGQFVGNGPPREQVGLSHVVDHIQRICDLAGDTRHVGIGSDLDGGYGVENTPHEMDTHTDLHRLKPLLIDRGFSEQDVTRVFCDNWLQFYRRTLPA